MTKYFTFVRENEPVENTLVIEVLAENLDDAYEAVIGVIERDGDIKISGGNVEGITAENVREKMTHTSTMEIPKGEKTAVGWLIADWELGASEVLQLFTGC